MMSAPSARPPRGRAPRRSVRPARRGLVCAAAAAFVALMMLLRGTHLLGGAAHPGGEGAAGGGSGSGSGAASKPRDEDWGHPLFSRIHRELDHFKSNITLQMVEQAYCQASRGSFRLQVVNGSAYVVGETPSYESRLLSIKLQLLPLYLEGQLPDGLDVVIEQEDKPTVPGNASPDCPTPGPLVAPSKQPSNESHSHVLLAPDFSFAGWPEAKTLAWADMLPLLRRAASRQPWERRRPVLFFRGAATGQRNQSLGQDLPEEYPGVLDIQLVNWTSPAEQRRFVPLTEHCGYKLLLHLAGNSYAGRLKYLLACGSAVVLPESPWEEFWYHLLRPGHHHVAVEEVDSFNQGQHLADTAQELQQDDGYARRVGEAGVRLVSDALAPARVQAYWRRLLRRYWERQAFNATRVHPDAIPLERSILVPELRNITERTCSLCQHTPEQWEAQRRLDLGLKDDEALPPEAEPGAGAKAAATADGAGSLDGGSSSGSGHAHEGMDGHQAGVQGQQLPEPARALEAGRGNGAGVSRGAGLPV
ncbi:hypothetical protein ABPG75_010138 [Micractinium tetrahymenae]